MSRLFLLLVLIFGLLLSGCGDRQKLADLNQKYNKLEQDFREQKADLQKSKKYAENAAFIANNLKDVHATIVTNLGNIDVSFFSDKAPLHCFAFITRAESGFYNGTQFHRVIPGFMIQGGDPNSKDKDINNDGMGGPLAMLPHEFNDINHDRGILSTARVSDLRAGAGSQFFIMHQANPGLNHQYTVFGKVTKGMEVVDKIATTKTYGSSKRNQKDHPVKPVIIRRIDVFRGNGK